MRRRNVKPGTSSRQAGFTLVELLLVAFLLLLVLGATLVLLERTTAVAPRDQERAHSIRAAQVGLHRMAGELRHAYAVSPPSFASSSDMDVKVVYRGANRRVLYSCDEPHPDPAYRRCLRFQGPPDFAQGLTGSGEVVIDRVANDPATNPVFTRNPSGSRHVRARVEVLARGERAAGLSHRVVLDDGFFMRNVP